MKPMLVAHRALEIGILQGLAQQMRASVSGKPPIALGCSTLQTVARTQFASWPSALDPGTSDTSFALAVVGALTLSEALSRPTVARRRGGAGMAPKPAFPWHFRASPPLPAEVGGWLAA